MRIEAIDPQSNIVSLTYDTVHLAKEDDIVKFVLVGGTGTLIRNTDDVYYKHETRHDNG